MTRIEAAKLLEIYNHQSKRVCRIADQYMGRAQCGGATQVLLKRAQRLKQIGDRLQGKYSILMSESVYRGWV